MALRNDRLALVNKIIEELRSTGHRIDELRSKSEKAFQDFCMETYAQEKTRIDNEMHEYRKNLEISRNLNVSITSCVNRLNLFTGDEECLGSMLSPLRYFMLKLRIKSLIRKSNAILTRLSIGSRIHEQKVMQSVNGLRSKAGNWVKGCDCYKELEELFNKKKRLLDDLSFLIPTITDFDLNTAMNNSGSNPAD